MPTLRLVLNPSLKRKLRDALKEDGAFRDVTTRAVIPRDLKASGSILAKSRGVLAGLPVARFLFSCLDRRCRFTASTREGEPVRPGQCVARVAGPARALLSAERVALNFLSRLSGIATLTRHFVRKVGKGRLYDTRKTTPLWRELERYAVRTGGGNNHRFDLSSQYLLKDNHWALGDVTASLDALHRRRGFKHVIEVEVKDMRQAAKALRAGVDILMVDNASPSRLRRIRRMAGKKVILEASGGLNLNNIGRYSRLGVERLSVGSLTHSAPAVDFSLELRPA